MPPPPSRPPERDAVVSVADEPPRVVGGPDARDAPTTAPLPRGLLVLLGVAGAAVSIAGLRSAAGIVAPTFLALVIVISVHPLPAWLRRHGLPAWAAVVLAMVCTYAILLGLVGAVVLSVTRLATLLPAYQSLFTTLIDEGAAWLDRLGVTAEQINSVVGALDPNSVLGVLQRVVGRAASITSDLLFILVLIFFLILDSSSFPRRLAVAAEQRPHVVAALKSFARGTRQYVVVSTVFGLIVAVADVAALYWLAVPLPLLWGLLSFITNYIPNIGFVLGLVPPALLGLLEGGVRQALLVVLAYSLINFVIQSLIQPKFVGDTVGLSATLTFLSLVFWSYVIGPLGALLAVPASLLTKACSSTSTPRAGGSCRSSPREARVSKTGRRQLRRPEESQAVRRSRVPSRDRPPGFGVRRDRGQGAAVLKTSDGVEVLPPAHTTCGRADRKPPADRKPRA